MAASQGASAGDRARISALTIGLAATVVAWTFAVAFAPEKLQSFADYSPWLYGPASITAWAFFSAVAYWLVRRDGRRNPQHNAHEGYRCRDFDARVPCNTSTICANQQEKNRLGAVTAGFALTISAWVAALSFMPEGWVDRLSQAPAWVYCIVSVIVWAASREVMYLIFRASSEARIEFKHRA